MAAFTRRLVAVAWLWVILGTWVPVTFQHPVQVQPLESVLPYGELRVGVDPSYPPFASLTPDGAVGFEIDLANAIANLHGVPIRFIYLGYDGLHDALLTDQVDALISAVTPENQRMDRVLYSAPYYNAGIVLVSPRNYPILGMEAVAGRRLAYAYASSAHEEAERWSRRILPFEEAPYQTAGAALDAVRLAIADAALVDRVSASLYSRLHPDWQISTVVVQPFPYTIAVRADRRALAVTLNATLAELEASGALETIRQRWL